MNKNQVVEILTWLFLVIGIALLIWHIFGHSPSEVYVLLPFILFLITKTWGISNELKEHKINYHIFKETVKNSFINLKPDIKRKIIK